MASPYETALYFVLAKSSDARMMAGGNDTFSFSSSCRNWTSIEEVAEVAAILPDPPEEFFARYS
jgi:hypothetical protein